MKIQWRSKFMKTQFLFPFVLVAAGGMLSAQSTLYVATFGSNANSCTTVTQPCATFAGALSKAGTGSTILALDSGDFGPMFIVNPVTIDGGAHGAFIGVGSGALGVIVSLPNNAQGGVTLRNLSIVMNDASTSQIGIQASIQSGFLVLDHVSVSAIQNQSSIDGIDVNVAAGLSVDLKDVTVSGARIGIDLFNTFNATTPFTANLENVSVTASNVALLISDGNANIRNTSLRGAHGTTSGIGVDLFSQSTSPTWLIENSRVASNSTGISVTGGTLRLSNNVITGNTTGISSTGATVISFRNNTFAGNGVDGSPLLSTSVK
jgi:hypothetical protein